MGDKSNQQVTFPRCAKYLESIGCGEYLDEITNGFCEGLSSKSGKEISSWGAESLAEWIGSLKFLQCEGAGKLIATSLLAEEIDGFTFMQIDENQWVRNLKLDLKHFLLLKCIRDGWNGAWGEAVEVPLGVPAAVVTGIVADLSGCDEELAKQLIEADNKCCGSGAGLFYGVLIVLGHKEYMVDGDKWKAVGVSNEKFVLKRRNIPNGIQRCVLDPNGVSRESRASASHIISMTVTNAHHDAIKWDMGSSNSLIGEAGGETKVIIRYKADPSKDMFQIGRMSEPLNDWTLRGPLHGDTQHGRTRGPRGQTGPVSRFACRIECDRLPPFKCRLFAAGFNADKEIFLGESAPKWFDKSTGTTPQQQLDSMDALTTFGIKLWNPHTRAWCEVSTQGRAYSLRSACGEAGEPRQCLDGCTNELVDGAIIDLCGVAFEFRSPKSMAKMKHVDPANIISQLNALKPQCPVLLHNIRFSYLNSRERALRAFHKLESEGVSFVPSGPFHIPSSDYSDVDEEHRSYVFPACGHVHGYHKSLDGRPCPMCRKVGPFVPIAFAFEPAIDHRKPTHVFNPCGHVASKQTCTKWAHIPMHESPLGPALITTWNDALTLQTRLRPWCPFCATPLTENSSEGGPFNKLVLQTESGQAWSSDDEDDEDTEPASVGDMAVPKARNEIGSGISGAQEQHGTRGPSPTPLSRHRRWRSTAESPASPPPSPPLSQPRAPDNSDGRRDGKVGTDDDDDALSPSSRIGKILMERERARALLQCQQLPTDGCDSTTQVQRFFVETCASINGCTGSLGSSVETGIGAQRFPKYAPQIKGAHSS